MKKKTARKPIRTTNGAATNGEIVWQEPPERTKAGRWDPIIASLKEKPNEWGKLPGKSEAASSLRARHTDCEFVTRKGELYGRFVG